MTIDLEKLVPMPKPKGTTRFTMSDGSPELSGQFTAAQMRDYAIAALLADRDQLAAEVEVLRANSFETVIQHLAATLPDDGSSITIYVEHWAGSVTATDWDGNEMPDPDCETVLGKVQEAAKWLNDQQSKLAAIDSARKE